MAGDRTQDARDHDDKDVIEGMIPGGDAVPSSSGGRLQTDIGSQADLGQVDDPDGDVRPTKQDDINNDQARRTQRPRD
ncbi:hypothetical protein [Sphingomonas aracearum]|uniref:Uncharacterized protein n=1 Tax=Sphingomonas aracearum TaxID=2283317 RepID=A0A369VXF2_9SPHN|nr:hypothetical protein [Sphingomonas aracearum]RDE06519.1 hypothetical protein DVW87_02065 [Sphingomonas aracearum]